MIENSATGCPRCGEIGWSCAHYKVYDITPGHTRPIVIIYSDGRRLKYKYTAKRHAKIKKLARELARTGFNYLYAKNQE